MILGIDQIGTRIKEQYDKVVAFIVLLLLLSSLIYLGVKVGLIHQMQVDFEGWLKSRRPVNPEAEVIGPDVYNAGKLSLEQPFQLDHAAWTNSPMFVPETRFNCRECRLPVHIDAKRCPFCKTEVEEPAPPNPDADGDGMPTLWEQRYGLDPFDAADAGKDNDNDGYTNLAEFKENTDPTSDASRPAAVERLVLESITGKRFGLRFNSRVKTGSGYKFGLNYQLPDGQTKTDFAEIGDKVSGFMLKGYEEKLVKVEEPFPHTADLSELSIGTEDGQTIVLVKGKARLHVELTAHLTLTLPDGSVTRQAVKKDETFELDGAMHRVIAIDVAEGRVVIRDERKQREIVVQRTPTAASEAVSD